MVLVEVYSYKGNSSALPNCKKIIPIQKIKIEKKWGDSYISRT